MGLVLRVEPGKYKPGEVIQVRSDVVYHHHRTPWFIKGRVGVIRAVSGAFLDPESRAYGGDGLPDRLLYQVEFRQNDVWGERYREDERDTLLVDIYEQWIEPLNGGNE